MSMSCAPFRPSAIRLAGAANTRAANAGRGSGSSGKRALLPAYGTELKGLGAGPSFVAPEPEEVWLSIVSSALPFKQHVACVTPNDGAVSSAIISRAQRHFPHVKQVPLQRLFDASPAGDSQPRYDGNIASSGSAVAVPAPGALAVAEPLSKLPADSLDAVVFSANSLLATPAVGDRGSSGALVGGSCWSLVATAQRALRPHGVLAFFGAARLRVVGPERVKRDFDDFVSLMDGPEAMTLLPAEETARHLSIQRGCTDLYLPHSGKRIRSFTSGFALTPSQLVGAMADWPQYKHFSRPEVLQQLATSGSEKKKKDGLKDMDAALVSRSFRNRSRYDPLEAFGLCIGDALDELPPSERRVTVEVVHFVGTCDNRPINSNRRRVVSSGAPDFLA